MQGNLQTQGFADWGHALLLLAYSLMVLGAFSLLA
jgi:hypothetical protein